MQIFLILIMIKKKTSIEINSNFYKSWAVFLQVWLWLNRVCQATYYFLLSYPHLVAEGSHQNYNNE